MLKRSYTQSYFAEIMGLGSLLALTLILILSVTMAVPIEVVAAIQTVAAIFFLAGVILSKQRGGISFVLALQFLLFVALPAQIQITAGVFPFYAKPTLDSMYTAFAVISASYLFLQLGFFVRGRRIVLHRTRATDVATYPLRKRYLTLWAWALAALAMILALVSGVSTMVAPRHEAAELFANAGGGGHQFKLIARSLGLVSFLITLQMALRADGTYRRINRRALIWAVPMMMFLYWPPALPRTYLIGPYIAISAILFDYTKMQVKLVLTAIAVPIIYILFPAIKVLGAGEGFSGFINAIGARTIGTYILRVDFDIFTWTAETISFLANGGAYRFGINFIGVIFFFVPRSVWPSKPIHTGEVVSLSQGFSYPNVSSPIWSEIMISFGVLAIPLFMFSAGALISRLERPMIIADPTRAFVAKILYLVGMAFAIIIVRGALNAVAAGFATAFYTLFVIMFFAHIRIKFLGKKPSVFGAR